MVPYFFDHKLIDMQIEDMVLYVAFYSNIVHQNCDFYKYTTYQKLKLKVMHLHKKYITIPFILFDEIYPKCILNFIFSAILIFAETLH